MVIPFEIAALEWFLEKHLRVCLESPDAMEARLIHEGWPNHLVLYARALMAEMTGKAGSGQVWRPGKTPLTTPGCVLVAEAKAETQEKPKETPDSGLETA